MGITAAMYSGISGLIANGEALSVIGNNIANVNTTGFKEGRALFSDVLSNTISGGAQVGRGVQVSSVDNIYAQGSFASTASSTDLAIQGDSLFVVDGAAGRTYTRDGAFHFNDEKVLVTETGASVLGYGINSSNGLSNGVLAPIDLTTFSSTPPNATSAIQMALNLDSTQSPPALAWDPANPVATSNFSANTTIFDSQGNQHTMSLYFVKTGGNAWDWHGIADDATAGSPVDGTLSFDGNGNLVSQTPLSTAAQSISFPNGVSAPQAINFVFNPAGTTQFSGTSMVGSMTQDGYAKGTLTKVSIDQKGFVNGSYSNGKLIPLAQVALAEFAAPSLLTKVGNNMFMESVNSGQPQISTASTAGVGQIFANSLEQSTVDLSTEFVNMITTQRAFTANSKTIQATDEMLQDVLSLKR